MISPRHALLASIAPLVLAGPAAAADIAVDAATEVSGVIVTAARDEAYNAGRISSATRTDTPLRDVPQAVSVVTDQLISDQSMQSMADVVRYVPGVTMGQGEGHRDAPTLRGNASTADFFVDGVRDDVQYFRDLYNVERVEVLKGPNAMIFGRGGGGGVINRVIKRADGSDARTVEIEAGAWDHWRAVADLAAPLKAGASVRLVGMAEDSGSYRDHVRLKRWGVTPSAAWTPMDGLTLSLAYEHLTDQRTVDRGVPSFLGRPAAAGDATFFGDPRFNAARTRVDVGSLAIEYAPNDTVVLRNRTVFGAYDKSYQNTYASEAARSGVTGLTPTTVRLQAYATDNDRENAFSQTDLVWTGATGGIEHTVLTGFELGRQVSDNRRRTGRFGGATGPTFRDVAFASPTIPDAGVVLAALPSDANNRTKATVAAAYLQDQIELSPHLQLIAGLRYDSVDIGFHDKRLNIAQRDFSRRDHLWSPRAGVVVKPVRAASLYASYSVSHLPSSGDQFGSLDASTTALKPERFENLEAGAKWEITPRLFATGAVYRLDRDNTRAADPANPGRVVLTGSQRTKGLELGLTGQVTRRWQVAGGYAAQSAKITSATTAAPAGRTVPLTPRRTLSLWNRYDFSDRAGVGLGLVRQGSSYASISNAVRLPGYTRVDAALFLTLTPELKAQVNVENLFDVGYVATSHGDNNILPGAPRTVRAKLIASF